MKGNTLQDNIRKLEKNKRAYSIYNQTKIRSALQSFDDGARTAFHLIPFLLHYKVDFFDHGDVLSGIIGYRPGTLAKNLFKKYFPKRKGVIHHSKEKNIEFLSLMGSVGTIAYNDGSDFDYWCCVSDDMDDEQMEKLNEKLRRIEVWCQEHLNVEVHIFSTSPKRLLYNDFGEVSKESSGSTMGKIIKAEYFRCSLHITGKIPLWWVVQPEIDDVEYLKMSNLIRLGGHYIKHELVDIGNVDRIPQEEFISGGLWQLNKGVFSPFKSLLKMALLVVYSDTRIEHRLLCNQLKHQILSNPSSMDHLDSYQFMVDLVGRYHEQMGDPVFSELVRKCFFLKVRPSVSQWWDVRTDAPRVVDNVMIRYCRQWKWSLSKVRRLERFYHMPVSEAKEIKVQLERYMIHALSILQNASRDHKIESERDKRDMQKMISRVHAVFNQRRNRVKWIYPPFDRFIRDECYTIRRSQTVGAFHGEWLLFKGDHPSSIATDELKDKHLIEKFEKLHDLLHFMQYNKLFKSSTGLNIDFPGKARLISNMKTLSQQYETHFQNQGITSLDGIAFSRNPVAEKWMISINMVPMDEKALAFGSSEELRPERNEVEEHSGEEKRKHEKLQDYIFKAPESENGSTTELLNDILKDLGTRFCEEVNIDVEDDYQEFLKDKESIRKNLIIHDDDRTIHREFNKRLSREDDPLNAGEGSKVTYLTNAELIEQNSWGEVSADSYHGPGWLVQCLSKVFSQCLKLKLNPSQVLDFHLGEGAYDNKQVKKRFSNLLNNLIAHFFPEKERIIADRDPFDRFTTRPIYFFAMGGLVHVLYRDGQAIKGDSFTHLGNAMVAMSLKSEAVADIAFDPSHKPFKKYAHLWKRSMLGKVNVYLEDEDGDIRMILVDEWNNFSEIMVYREDVRVHFPKMIFSLAVCTFRTKIRNTLLKTLTDEPLKIEWMQVNRDGIPSFANITHRTLHSIRSSITRLHRLPIKMKVREASHFLNVFASEDRYHIDDEQTLRTLYRAVSYLKKARKNTGGDTYRVFYTDIDVSRDNDIHSVKESPFPHWTAAWFYLKYSLEDVSTSLLQKENNPQVS